MKLLTFSESTSESAPLRNPAARAVTVDRNREALLQLVESRSDLDGRFVDICRIGTSGGDGNFSLVFKATDITTNQSVALKFYHPQQRNDPYRWTCFKREAALLYELRGQNDIITSLASISEFTVAFAHSGFSIDIPFAYYPVELASHDVASAIANGQLDPQSALLTFRAMCRAVQRLHRQQLCHRDLKPGNFLVLPDKSVKLSDLGTACRLDGKTPHLLNDYSSFYPGDMFYASPEVMTCIHDEDFNIHFCADMFALGAILFELFTGLILGPQLLDAQYSDLLQTVAAVPRGHKRRIFDSLIGRFAGSHPLPKMQDFSSLAPPSIDTAVNQLYQSLATLDYRRRLYDFSRVFLQIDRCLLVLRNETAYRRWRENKRRREERRPTTSRSGRTLARPRQ